MWAAFAGIVLAMLAVIFFAAGGGKKAPHIHEGSGVLSVGLWVGAALFSRAGFGGISTARSAASSRTKNNRLPDGYVVEKALAVDNVFVWMTIFGYFAIPLEPQRRVLPDGVAGAVILRTVMIFPEAAGSPSFTVAYAFALFCLHVIKMAWLAEHDMDIANNPVVRWIGRRYPVTEGLEGERFSSCAAARDGTPFLALVMVEISGRDSPDDSIPAIFAITTDPYRFEYRLICSRSSA